jgi:hypothetical protein
MTFQPAIPLASDFISISQGDLKNNFGALSTAWNVDHVDFNATGAGDHLKVTLKAPLTLNPDKATPIASIYTKASPTTTTSDLYYQDGALASNVKQLTGGGITAAAWCVFDGTAASPISPGASYNITSITRSTNTYTLSFTRAFTNANYAVIVTPSLNTTDPIAVQITQGTTTCSIIIRTNGAGSSGGNNISVVCFGVLA